MRRRGEVPVRGSAGMMIDYMGPSLDTTILGISSACGASPTYPDHGIYYAMTVADPAASTSPADGSADPGFLALRGA